MCVVSISTDWLFCNLCASVFCNLQFPSSCFCKLPPRAFAPFSGSGARAILGHLSLRFRLSEPTLINQRNSFNAQGKVSPLVMGRCRSSCSKGQGGMLTFVFNPITPSPITYVQLLFVARRPGWVSDQAKYIKNPNMVDSLRRVHLLCI
jgi:hypothetical protein